MPPTRHEAAAILTAAYSDLDPGIVQVFMIQEQEDQEMLPTTPITLLQVNLNTPARGIIP